MTAPISTLTDVSGSTQEIRLAATMTGGVSLAIWMGGVARELNLLMQASAWRRARIGVNGPTNPRTGDEAWVGRYFQLLDLMDVLVDVDVQSGTSAGGINSVLLAYCRANDHGMGIARQTWLDLADLENLLRDPADENVPSLMYGDDKLLVGIQHALQNLKASPRTVANQRDSAPPSTLFVTTTLLDGEETRFTDGMGTVVSDFDHRGVFTFTEKGLKEPGCAAGLALAARSTSAYPGAFEPSFLPAKRASLKTGDVAARPAVGELLGTTAAHWAADGGLMDNEPLDLVLRQIFDTAARRPVRRVLLYVVPIAGPDPNTPAATVVPDMPGDPPGLLEALLKDVSSAMSQSITRDLRAINDHNGRVASHLDTRLLLVRIANQLRAQEGQRPSRLLQTEALANYADRVATSVAAQLTDSFLRAAATAGSQMKWASMFQIGSPIEATIRETIQNEIRSSWPVTALPTDTAGFAKYGQAALDAAKAIVLHLVSLADACDAGSGEKIRTAQAGAHAAATPEPGSRIVDAVRDDNNATYGDAYKQDTPEKAAKIVATLYKGANVKRGQWRALADSVIPILKARDGKEFTAYRDYLIADGTDTEEVATRLFDLGVTVRSLQPPGVNPDQAVTLVQISADTRSNLSNLNSAYTKLTGTQLHHFGAFYKRSWRANDWMWGRLDGAGWLVHILLDPSRLKAVTARLPAQDRPGSAGLIAELRRRFPELDEPDQAIRAELAYLNADASIPVPVSLPRMAIWLAQAWQRPIADDELDLLAEEILAPGSWSPVSSVSWANRVKKADPKYPLLQECPVSKETLDTDRPSPLMARTASKAIATATSTVAGIKQLPTGVRPILSTARTVTTGAFRIVSTSNGKARWLILIGAVIAVIAGLLVPQFDNVIGPILLGVAAAGVCVMAVGVWQRLGKRVAIIIGIILTAGIVSLTLHPVQTYLFGTTSQNSGEVGSNIHWLSGAWWRPLLTLAILLLIFNLCILAIRVTRRKPRRRRATAQDVVKDETASPADPPAAAHQ
jgi:predicted acylesterase/phospholipase RssA